MKWFLSVLSVLILAASPLKACDRVSAFSNGVGHCAVGGSFYLPPFSVPAVFQNPGLTYSAPVTEIVPVPVRVPDFVAVPVVRQVRVVNANRFHTPQFVAQSARKFKQKNKIKN